MKLWVPKECCLCFSLRTGSLILSILMMVSCALNMYVVLSSLLNGIDEEVKNYCSVQTQEDEHCETQMKKMATSVGAVQVTQSIIKMICSGLMIYGIKKSITSFMMPMMVLLLIQLMFTLVSGLVMIVVLAIFVSGGIAFGVALFLGILIFFETYFLLVFRAYYLQIKRGSGEIHDVLQEEADNVGSVPEQSLLLKLK